MKSTDMYFLIISLCRTYENDRSPKVAVSSRACLIAHDEPLPLSHAAPRVNRKFPAIQEPRVGDSVEGDSPDLHTVGSA